MFEMTTSFMMTSNAPGVPEYNLPNKILDMHRHAFLPGQLVTRRAGEMLADWADGMDLAGADKALWDRARAAAHQGHDVLQLFYETQVDDDERQRLRPIAAELQRLYRAADRLNQENLLAEETPIPEPVSEETVQSNIDDLFGDPV